MRLYSARRIGSVLLRMPRGGGIGGSGRGKSAQIFLHRYLLGIAIAIAICIIIFRGGVSSILLKLH